MSNNNEYNEAIKKAHYKLNKQAINKCSAMRSRHKIFTSKILNRECNVTCKTCPQFCNGSEYFCFYHKPCEKCIVGSGKLHNHSGRHKRKHLQLCSRCYLPETEFNKISRWWYYNKILCDDCGYELQAEEEGCQLCGYCTCRKDECVCTHHICGTCEKLSTFEQIKSFVNQRANII